MNDSIGRVAVIAAGIADLPCAVTRAGTGVLLRKKSRLRSSRDAIRRITHR
jgi:predicted NAD/FAD-dependent oxidoreductase